MIKQAILDNVQHYSSNELIDHILSGTISYMDLVYETEGQFEDPLKAEVKRLLEAKDSEAWSHAKGIRTKESIQDYLDVFNNNGGKYLQEARDLYYRIDSENVIDVEWDKLDKASSSDLRNFSRKFPSSKYEEEVKKCLARIIDPFIHDDYLDLVVNQIRRFDTNRELTPIQRDNNIVETIVSYIRGKKITKEQLLHKIKEDPNILNSAVINRLVNSEEILFVDDLLSIGINKLFIQKMLAGENAKSFPKSEPLDRINKQSTEVYFWGIPSSGKSCALGAILSVASNGLVAKSMDKDVGSQGYGYMTKLINLFENDKVGTLMEGTAVDSFYEMGFDLVDLERRIHPITCIDMAGELMRCMYKANAGDPMSELENVMLETLTKVLIDNRSTNRKIHFFVIEYGAEDKLYEGLPQRVYLDGALSYVKNTDIFKKETDAIFIMITKTDKLMNPSKELIIKYISEKYKGFYNGLEDICINYEINKGQVDVIPFSLGEVCFQNFCKFNSKPADNIVRILLNRSASYRGGKRGWWLKLLRS